MFSQLRIALYVPLIVLSACGLMERPQYPPDIELRGLRLEQLAANRQVFTARLALKNPNDIPLRLHDGRIGLALEGIDVGEGSLLTGFSIPALGSEEVDIQVATNLLQDGPKLLQWLFSGDQALDFQLKGHVDLARGWLGRLRINESGNITRSELNQLFFSPQQGRTL